MQQRVNPVRQVKKKMLLKSTTAARKLLAQGNDKALFIYRYYQGHV